MAAKDAKKTVLLDLDAIGDRASRAVAAIGRLCEGERFTMKIPADPKNDHDLILSHSISDIPALIAEVRRLRGLFADLESASDACDPNDKLDPDGDTHVFRRAVNSAAAKARLG